MTTEQAPATTEAPQPAAQRVSVPASVIVAVLALPVFFLLGAPLAGWAVATGLLVANMAVHWYIMRSVGGGNTLAAGAAAAGSMFARMWTSAGVILLVGVTPMGKDWFGSDAREVGLGALILFTILFTLDVARRIRVHAAEVEAAAAIETPLSDTPKGAPAL
jgi:hypothetical protein